MKMDMVNPMPAKTEAAVNWCQVTDLGNWLLNSLIITRQATIIPIGFPTTKPNIIPNPFSLYNPRSQPSFSVMPVLAKAKSGRIINATGLCKACCNR